MQNTQKRADKCLHYYLTNKLFASIIDNFHLNFRETTEEIRSNFSDLTISTEELRSFYRAKENQKNYSPPCPVFSLAGEKARNAK